MSTSTLPANTNLYIPASYLKDVAIEIHPEYRLSNSPSPVNRRNFLGREVIAKKFLTFLRDTSSGVYLVTGYRGMGKTSFVNRVLDEYRSEFKHKDIETETIRITVAQNTPTEIEILKLICSEIYHCYSQRSATFEKRQKRQERKASVKRFIPILLIPVALTAFFVVNEEHVAKTIALFSLPREFLLAFYATLLGFIILIIVLMFSRMSRSLIWPWKRSVKDPLYQIEDLYKKCYATISLEESDQATGFEQLVGKVTGQSRKRTESSGLASSKDIEFFLSHFFTNVYGDAAKGFHKDKKKMQFVIVFDELDKVDPAITTSYYNEELDYNESIKDDGSYLRDLRQRKQAILNIIAGLKNFLTNSNARFIFIAGREMFDASLADIADRQSAISSIFNYIFYVESFLKEKPIVRNNKSSLSAVIEDYLSIVLFNGASRGDQTSFFAHAYAVYLATSGEAAARKAVILLQSFIIYLTYRSNGSPKKLIRAIHEFIEQKEPDEDDRLIWVFRHPQRNEKRKTARFLFFDYSNQHRLGFISYLYRPFLISYGRSYKNFSDNIIVSTPYLFDHLLKFHPFAFSLTNLEMIPEVLSTNKTPSLRKHIQNIIDYLAATHIRETEVGLFDYKFYSRTLNEINFISKTFEEESAAFNFTLDEAYLVKLHVRNKIKELRSGYAKFAANSEGPNQQVFSIAHMNDVLGDLHFFDQEYDDAIISYADSIRPINNLNVTTMNMRDFIMLIRIKLKLGLVFEKIKSYEEALAFYSDASQDSKRFIAFAMKSGRYLGQEEQANEEKRLDVYTYHTSSLNDLLQVINQCFLAKIILEEKMGIEGATTHKLAVAMGGFLKLGEQIEEVCGRNHLVIANVYLTVGNLLYFKNSNRMFNIDAWLASQVPQSFFDKLSHLKTYYEAFYNLDENKRKPVSGLYLYIIGVLEVLSSRQEKNVISLTTHNLTPHYIPNLLDLIDEVVVGDRYSRNHFKYIAIFLSHIGDCLLSMLRRLPVVEGKFQNLYQAFRFDPEVIRNEKLDFNSLLADSKPDRLTIQDVLRCYYKAAAYFLRTGRSVSASFQYRKILYTLRLIIGDKEELWESAIHQADFLNALERTILCPILEIIAENGMYSDRHMLKKFTTLFSDAEANKARHHISNHPEAREAILLFSYIQIKIQFHTYVGSPLLIDSNNSIATVYTRLMEYDYHAKIAFVKLAACESGRLFTAMTDGHPTVEKYAIDYLYDMTSILRILNLYGNDYMVGLSYLAYAHYRIAEFLAPGERFTTSSPWEDGTKKAILHRVNKHIRRLLNRDSGTLTDEVYHYGMAKTYYEKALQLHTVGKEYKNTIRNIIYLEDDINDNAYHFGAAMDRFMVSNGIFEARIQRCNAQIKKSRQYTYKAYT